MIRELVRLSQYLIITTLLLLFITSWLLFNARSAVIPLQRDPCILSAVYVFDRCARGGERARRCVRLLMVSSAVFRSRPAWNYIELGSQIRCVRALLVYISGERPDECIDNCASKKIASAGDSHFRAWIRQKTSTPDHHSLTFNNHDTRVVMHKNRFLSKIRIKNWGLSSIDRSSLRIVSLLKTAINHRVWRTIQSEILFKWFFAVVVRNKSTLRTHLPHTILQNV